MIEIEMEEKFWGLAESFGEWARLQENMPDFRDQFIDGEIAEYIVDKCNIVGFMLEPIVRFDGQTITAKSIKVPGPKLNEFIEEIKDKRCLLFKVIYRPDRYITRTMDENFMVVNVDPPQLTNQAYWYIRFAILD
jgi:hypothetical protein